MVDLVRSSLLPSKVLILADGDKDSFLYKEGPELLRGMKEDAAPGTAFVCKDFACSAPVTDVAELAKMLEVECGEKA